MRDWSIKSLVGYLHQTTPFTTEGSMHKRRQEDCKSQKIREFAVRLCLLVMSEVIFLCCLFVCLFVFQYENHFWKMLWSLSFHSSFLSVAVLIHSDQKQHRGKIALYQLPGYSPSLKRSESWNSSRTLKQWPWRNNSYWLAGRFTQLAFVCSTGPTCPRKQWTWIS